MSSPPHGPAPRLPVSLPASKQTLTALLLLAALALATRAWFFGNPLINDDEQFYLMLGDRMIRGDLPYVDIWDRKPIGLFLIYGLAARLFDDPVTGYQLMATASVILTTWLLFALARRLVSYPAALAGASVYPAWLTVFGGIGGQSPVFFNPPMAAAAALLIAVLARPDARRLTRQGGAIMLLVGLAMQVKYTAVFEGVFFGLTLLWIGLRRGRGPARIAADAFVWIACALAPTLAAIGAYLAMGHFGEFVRANFLSVLQDRNDLLPVLGRLAGLCLGLSPLWLCVWLTRRGRWTEDGSRTFICGWILAWHGAALAGFLLFGGYADHYVLPLLVPLSLLMAISFERAANRRMAFGLILGLGLVGGLSRVAIETRANGNTEELSRLAELARPHLGGGCLYVNEDLPALYRLTGGCLPSRFAFPPHLTWKRYEHGLGTDQLGELGRVLGGRPDVVVIAATPNINTRPAARRLLAAVLNRDYILAGSAPVGSATYEVYRARQPKFELEQQTRNPTQIRIP